MSISEFASVADGEDVGKDIDELLDPDVFELPPVGPVPSLEEILKENGNELDDPELNEILEDVNHHASNGGFEDSSEVTSVATSSSFSRDFIRSGDWKKPVRKQPKSQVLRCVKLRGVSSQIISAEEKIKCGVPSALAVGSNCVAVGTTHGVVLVFDSKQVLKCCLGNAKNVLDYGGVSTMCFNRDSSKLLLGYGKGLTVVYDIKSQKLVQQCDTIQTIFNGVLHAQFTDSNSVALINDSGGSVYALNFGKLSKMNNCRCIFSGSRGEVCHVIPLTIPDVARGSSHHYSDPLLVAMASMTKVIVVRLRPSVRVIFASPCEGQPHTPPMLSWQFVPLQVSAKSRILDPVLAFGRDRFITFYQLHSSDGQSFRSFFLQKLELPSDSPSFVNCVWLNSRCVLTLNEKQRAQVYEISSGQCMETINIDHVQLVYSTSIFKGLATGGNVSKAMVCLSENVCYSSLASYSNGGQILLLGSKGVYALSLNTWLDRVTSLVSANDYAGAITLCLDFYTGKRKVGLSPHNRSNRWQEIIEEKALELLLEYVDLSLTRLSPSRGKVEALQEHYKFVVPFCIDACVTFNREDILYDRIYTRFSEDLLAKCVFLECLDDYIIDNVLKNIPPIVVQDFFNHLEREGLYPMIEQCVVNLPITSIDIHQVMTVCRMYNLYDGIIYVYTKVLQDYLSPLKDMLIALKDVVEQRDLLSDEDIRLGNKVLLYISCCLTGRSYPVGYLQPEESKKIATDTYELITAIKTTVTSFEEPAYPYLRTLLKFDCREFLNGLGMAFECDFFLSRNGCLKTQRLVDILIRVVLNSNDWTPLQIGALFTFITRQAVMKSGELLIGRDQFQKILEVVMCGDVETVGTSSFEERQQALLDLLQLKEAKELIEEKTLLSMAEKHRYYQVCEVLYWRRREFHKILDCYIEDDYRKRFAGSDYKECGKILNEYFETSLIVVCNEFGEDKTLLGVLKEIYDIRQTNECPMFCQDESSNEELIRIFVKLLCLYDIDLLNRLLKSNDSLCIDDVLVLCRKCNVSSAVVYLLTLKNEWEEAFEFVKQDLRQFCISESDFSKLSISLKVAVNFVNSCHGKRDRTNCEKMWFDLLDILLSRDKKTGIIDEDMKSIINDLVQAMMTVVDPAVLLTKLLEHPTFKNGQYSEIESMVNSILHGYEYEEVLLSKVLDCMHGEIHSTLVNLHTTSAHAVGSKVLTCSVCWKKMLEENQSRCVVFSCGHGYHCVCLQSSNSFHQGTQGVREWVCFICSRKFGYKNNAKLMKISLKGNVNVQQDRPNSNEQKNKFLPSLEDAKDISSLPLKIELLDEIHDKNPFAETSNTQRQSVSRFDDKKLKLRLGPPRS